ncbi:DUF5622 domain-containing protein [Sulfolobus acidocaldarius]|uniref:DUF5622 domain-containing protein n=1 Tax=Sulfolobus acidocaldarius TaxID=2285 RepID=UPI000780CC29|nr:DUF5622 domain-containing protein [Sulfolobus acidocaldarius]
MYKRQDIGDQKKFLKVRFLKSRSENNNPEAYVILDKISIKLPRNAKVIKYEDLPAEVKDKLKLKLSSSKK